MYLNLLLHIHTLIPRNHVHQPRYRHRGLHALRHARAVGRAEDEVHAVGGEVAVEGEGWGGGGEVGGEEGGGERGEVEG